MNEIILIYRQTARQGTIHRGENVSKVLEPMMRFLDKTMLADSTVSRRTAWSMARKISPCSRPIDFESYQPQTPQSEHCVQREPIEVSCPALRLKTSDVQYR